MKRDVSVTVTGIHSRVGEPTEKVITNSRGVYEELDDGRCFLEYVEEQDSDGSKIKVHNKVYLSEDGKNMDIVRGGDMNSKLSFGEKKEYDTEYNTPYGTMNMKVITKSFDFNRGLADETIKVVVEYALELDGMALSDSMIIIEIKNAETI